MWRRVLDSGRLTKSGCAIRRMKGGQYPYQHGSARYTLPRFAKMGVMAYIVILESLPGNSQDVYGLSVYGFMVICGKTA